MSKPTKKIANISSQIQKSDISDKVMCFSFKYFDNSDEEICPPQFRNGYTQTLMCRMRDLSGWSIKQFIGTQHKSVRNHAHDWSKTSRPDGFNHLNSTLRDYEGWQFQLTANEHGRVHGIIIDNIFHVIWLDCDHKLYP